MSVPYTEEMMESVKKVEATRAARMAAEPRRMTAEEKDALLEQYHPDYNLSSFAEIIVGPNKGEKAPKELVELLQAKSRVQGMTLDLAHPDYDVDVLVIGGGGSGASAAIEAHEAGANGQVATQYVDYNGNLAQDEEWNMNGSYAAIEGITSPDGRVYGKMAHSERIGDSVAINIYGEQDLKLFESGVKYFK